MRKILSLFTCLLIVVSPSKSAYSAEDDLSGFTLQQLSTALDRSGIASEKLYSLITFDSEDRDGSNIAVLSASREGWRVTVLHKISGGLEVQWNSGKLSSDFDMSSSSNLEIHDVGDEQVVEFSECAQHQCGLKDGVFGIMLYSPQSKQVFFAHYRFDERKPMNSFGSLKYSENCLQPENKSYKSALDEAVKKVLHL